jgi:hypothetical protein
MLMHISPYFGCGIEFILLSPDHSGSATMVRRNISFTRGRDAVCEQILKMLLTSAEKL